MSTTRSWPRYKNEEGKIAVLYSPCYGSPWSYNSGQLDEVTEFLLFDPFLVQLALDVAPQEQAQARFEEVWGDQDDSPYHYFGGWMDIEVAWLEEGQHFRITEYDGFEQIEYIDKIIGHYA